MTKQDEKLAGLRNQLHQISEELNEVVTASWRGLAASYTDCTADFVAAREAVSTTHTNLLETKRRLADLKKDEKFHSSMALLAEISQGKEGHINGSNEPTRKIQREAFLGQLPEEDATYKVLIRAIQATEIAVDQAIVEHEDAKNKLSAIRNTARMLAGLGHAMGA